MKILQVSAYAAPYEGNFVKSLKSLEKELLGLGHETIYAFPESAKKLDWCKELEKNSIVYYLPLAKARIKPATYNILKQIYRKHPDIKIVHSHFELYDIPIALTSPKNVEVYWHLHDAISNYKDLKNRIMHKIQYAFLHKNSKLLSVSKKHMEYVVKLGFPKNNAKFIPNGLDLERIKLVDKLIDDRKYDFLMFGWEYERKGVDLCLEALKKLDNRYTVAIIGSESTKSRIKENYGELDNVYVIEPVEDINEIFEQTKFFLHISRAEGLSYALLESLYAGLNVICSDIDENLFALKFPTVHMIQNENVDMIADKIEMCMNQLDISNDNIQKTRTIIENDYSINTWVRNVLEEYRL